MCGIFGKVSFKVIQNKDSFQKALFAIRHRGPDDSGHWFSDDGKIGLGSVRLAIQDLSPNGHMPMFSPDDRYVIVFNGEIYNHLEVRKTLVQLGYSFKSGSDTETVLYGFIEWGTKSLDYFKGMFAIAIYDQHLQKLFLARDRSGEKPLYYWSHSHGFTFGSELKQLLLDESLPRRINKEALKKYLQDGFLSVSQSFIEGVNKLPPAHYLIYDIKTSYFSIERYWSIPVFQNRKKRDQELLEKYDTLLSASVKQQLISDVPLGVLLSGGVDSSLVTSYAAEQANGKIKTFHISFDGFGKYNEAAYAKKVAEYFDTEHIELSGNEMSYELIDEVLNFYDEPLGDSSMLPTYLVSGLTRKHVTVALGGDAGDELFGGYTTYRSLLSQRRNWGRVPDFIRKGLAATGSLLPVGFKGRNFLKNLPGSDLERFNHNRLFDGGSLYKLINPDYRKDFLSGLSKAVILDSGSLVYDMTSDDFQNYLPEDILVKVDRASMAHSLEMRAPFLDKDLIEFAFGEVPAYLKTTESDLKIISKKLLKKRMPVDFDVNRKQGFSIPLNDWIADKWYNQFMDEIDQNLPEFLNKELVLTMCRNVKKGYSNSSRLFALIILSKWMAKYKIIS